VDEEATHLTIRPPVDKRLTPGHASSISDEWDNIHWFRARSPIAFTFDVIVFNIDPAFGKSYQIDNIDPFAAERVGDDLWRAPKLNVETALRK